VPNRTRFKLNYKNGAPNTRVFAKYGNAGKKLLGKNRRFRRSKNSSANFLPPGAIDTERGGTLFPAHEEAMFKYDIFSTSKK
jgi:hypothetical protein